MPSGTMASDPVASRATAARSIAGTAAARVLPTLALLLVWEAAARWAGHRLFPPPSAVFAALAALAASGALARNLGITLYRVACAFTVAMVLGTALGMAMGRWRRLTNCSTAWSPGC